MVMVLPLIINRKRISENLFRLSTERIVKILNRQQKGRPLLSLSRQVERITRPIESNLQMRERQLKKAHLRRRKLRKGHLARRWASTIGEETEQKEGRAMQGDLWPLTLQWQTRTLNGTRTSSLPPRAQHEVKSISEM
jgi:hypothetical protein